MAINKFKNDISQEEFRGQRLTAKDLREFGRGFQFVNLPNDDPNFIFVTKIYDNGNTLLDVKVETTPPAVDPRTNELLVNPEKTLTDLGYGNGTFRVEYNFWQYKVGNSSRPGVFVKEISPSRTEVRILPTKVGDEASDAKNTDDFSNFSNLVLTAEEAGVLLDDIFDEITQDGIVDVMLASLNEQFKQRLYFYSRFETQDDADALLRHIIEKSIAAARPLMVKELTTAGFVSFLRLLEVYDTILREQIFNSIVEQQNHIDFIELQQEIPPSETF